MTKLDDMLSKWPMPQRPQLEADEAAERVIAAIEAGQLPAALDEGVLSPPLPKTADEGDRPEAPQQVKISAPPTPLGRVGGVAGVENKMSKDRTRDRTSFQELAKMATTPPPPTSVAPPSVSSSGQAAVTRGKEADSSDSGIVDLKMIASADPSGEQRAQTTPLAAQGLFEDESAPAKPSVAASAAERLASAPPPAGAAPAVAQAAPVASAKASLAPQKPAEKKGGGGVLVVLGSLVAAGAIAAGVFFYVRHQHAQSLVATTTTTAPDKVDTHAEQPKASTTAAATGAASVAIETPDELPEVDQNGKPTGHSMGKFHAHHAAGASSVAAAASATAEPGTVDPKLVANIPTGGAGGGSGDLSEAMKAAAGGGTGLGGGSQQTDQGPKFAPGTVPQHPSQGQVAGAIGSVMPAARACVPGGAPVSRATITFQSDGTVKNVSVTGYAAGKSAEACIKGALSKAKVDPFAEATYPMTVSVRAD